MSRITRSAGPGLHKVFQWELLILLWFAFFLNQADRQIFSVVLPLIRSDLGLSDAELGLIASALFWTYGLLVPFAGFAGDKFSRRNITGFALLFWSLSTLSTGMCSTLMQFILLRGVATGGGEAFYAPAANALLGETYPKNRAFVLSIHQTGNYAGVALSGLIAGYVGEHYGWERAFFLFGGVGIFLAYLIFKRLPKDNPMFFNQESSPAASSVRNRAIRNTLVTIGRKPTFWLLTFGFGCMVFVHVGYSTWMPSFLAEKFSLSLANAGFSSLFYHHLGALLGVLSGARIADHYANKQPKVRLIVQALGLLAGAPFIYWMSVSTSQNLTYTALFIFGIFRGWYDSNIVASLYEIVPLELRSTAYGLMLMCAFLIGAASPVILGLIKPLVGMSTGLSYLSLIYILGAGLIGIAATVYFKRDREYSNVG
jgi:MFS family permease